MGNTSYGRGYREKEGCSAMRKPTSLLVMLIRLLVMALCALALMGLFSIYNPQLLVLSRTSVIVLLSFAIVYILMCSVYGGFEIGIRKSRSIIATMSLVVLFSDLVAHLFLCIMNYTIIHQEHFVYEHPWLLLTVFAVQIGILTGMAYLGNGVYFTINKPQRCLVIAKQGDDCADWVTKIARYKKQYAIEQIAYLGDDGLLSKIDAADTVFIYDLSESERAWLVEYCYQQRKDIYYSMELSDVVTYSGKQIYFDDATVLYAAAEKISPEEQVLKRIVDILMAVIFLTVASPVLLITAAAIKLEDGGDVFYRQKRATIDGREFSIVKFRSMRPEVGGIHRSVTSDDDRITKVGRLIRKYRIDELPQFFNVIRGDMSIVGPRPEMLENIEKYTEELPQFSYRLRAKAGLTGLAQVYGRYNTSPKDKMILDLIYIENFSVWLDIKIFLRTVLVLFTPEKSTEAFKAESIADEPLPNDALRGVDNEGGTAL